MDALLHDPLPSMVPPSLLTLDVLNTKQAHILTTILTLVIPVLTLLYIHQDYKAFLSLGPGGTPPTPLGYLKIKVLALLSLRDPLRPIAIPPHFRPQRGYCTTLPTRQGNRPFIRGIAPQRQQTQKSSAQVYKKLVEELRRLAKKPENKLVERTSCFEKHSSGLFSSVPITRTCGGEVCHAHPSDGSMHLTLHPADVRVLIEAGWGERHPLAKGGWFRRFVPKEFVLVYAPRNEEEVDVVIKIVAASIWWVSGKDVQGEEGGRGDRRMSESGISKSAGGDECWACKMHGVGQVKKDEMVADS
jgi:hypothetical protein